MDDYLKIHLREAWWPDDGTEEPVDADASVENTGEEWLLHVSVPEGILSIDLLRIRQAIDILIADEILR